MTTIAITGGIGSGKSVVSEILRNMNFAVYDCDSKAKLLMAQSSDIKNKIKTLISEDAITGTGNIDKKILSKIVFNDINSLNTLNSIVHNAVKHNFNEWRLSLSPKICWVETAILYESGFDKIVDCAWEVSAPIELRRERVIKRNNLSLQEVNARINSQKPIKGELPTKLIINDGITPLLPQIESLISALTSPT